MEKTKLGYTFYPKDWRSSDNVLMLSLQEKGFYRELLDECYLQNSNEIQINEHSFARRHGINARTFKKLLQKFCETSLIVIQNNEPLILLIPSVSKRLGIKHAASNGGKVRAKKSAKEKENIKENINEKENIEFALPLEFNNDEFKAVWIYWLDYRKKLGARKYAAPEVALKKLLNDSNSDCGTAIKMIQQSIANNWQGLFALKPQSEAKFGNPYKFTPDF